MMKKWMAYVWGVLLVLFCSWYCLADPVDYSDMDGLEAFGAGYLDEFDQYKKQENRQFELYKRIYREEFHRYKKEILAYWRDGETSGRKRWLEYSPDYKTRKIVDYEKGEIIIQMVRSPEEARPDQEVTRVLKDLVTQTSKDAFKRDQLSQRIETRLVSSVMDVKTSDSMAEAPMVTEMVTGTSQPTEEQVDMAVNELKAAATIEEKSGASGDEKIVSFVIKIPDERLQKKALQFADNVEKYSKERELDPSLVFAIMQTESSFNPLAKSHIPAYGLMQIVPRSAGKDATNFIYGKPKLLAPSFLYDCENNIMVGTAYLKVLTSRYLRAIKDDTSRTYCAIAAYNTGASNVARAFIKQARMSKAAPVINKMTPDDVYAALVAKLPQTETRNYVIRVTDRMKHYQMTH